MKRIIIMFITLLILTFTLCSCNMSCGPGNFTFKHLHVISYNDTDNVCLPISKWYDNSTGIEVKTPDGNSYFFSEGTYILIENAAKCPYCGSDFKGGIY